MVDDCDDTYWQGPSLGLHLGRDLLQLNLKRGGQEGHVLYGGEGSSSNAPPPEPAASSSGTDPPVEQAADAADVKKEVKTEGE